MCRAQHLAVLGHQLGLEALIRALGHVDLLVNHGEDAGGLELKQIQTRLRKQRSTTEARPRKSRAEYIPTRDGGGAGGGAGEGDGCEFYVATPHPAHSCSWH